MLACSGEQNYLQSSTKQILNVESAPDTAKTDAHSFSHLNQDNEYHSIARNKEDRSPLRSSELGPRLYIYTFFPEY